MSCDIDCRRCLDLTLLWLWCSMATEAPIRPLAWETPYAAGAALKKKKKIQKAKTIQKMNITDLSRDSLDPFFFFYFGIWVILYIYRLSNIIKGENVWYIIGKRKKRWTFIVKFNCIVHDYQWIPKPKYFAFKICCLISYINLPTYSVTIKMLSA